MKSKAHKAKMVEAMFKGMLEGVPGIIKKANELKGLDIVHAMDGFMSHVIFVSIDDFKHSPYFIFGDYVYIPIRLTNNGGEDVMTSIGVFDRRLAEMDDDQIAEFFKGEEVFIRDVNTMVPIDESRGFDGFWIMSSGGIYISYGDTLGELRDGNEDDDDDVEPEGGMDVELNPN